MEQLEDQYAIGLDLGTTFSCIGVYRNGGVEIIPNRNGETITPSIVILTNDSKILVGEETTDFLVKNYDSCIYEIKRLIGREFSDSKFQEEKEKLPFKIVRSNQGDYPEVEVQVEGETKKYSPVEISSFIIKKMKENAENYLNKKINNIIITVPAYFNNSQRKLTKQAAELIGLKVLRVINEPTAAALAYGFDKKENTKEKILIFDLGGGTFDVSILDLSILSEKDEKNKENYKSFKVLSTSGDTHLGGEDFDNTLVEFFLKKIIDDKSKLMKKEESDKWKKAIKEQVMKDKQAIKRLKVSCENLKKILSNAESAILRINNFYMNEDISEKITRKEFEEECEPLFQRIEKCLEDALTSANLKKEDINQIILVGGSTRIPKVKELVQNYFPKCKINNKINPDEAVAYGATIDAEKILHNKDNNNVSNFHLIDIIPLSLGTNIKNLDPLNQKEGDVMSIILNRGTIVPTFGEKTYYSASDDQTSMIIDIYEGEKKYVKYNHLLTNSIIEGLTKRPKGKTKVTVKFEVDVNGILNVKAKEESENNDGKTLELTIKNDDITLSNDEIEKLKKKNKKLLEKIKIKDYSNIKDILKKYKDEYEKCKNDKGDNDDEEEIEENKKTYISNFNEALEEFIDKFDIDFDNETVFEKYYLYIKELFSSYVETLTLELSMGEKKKIYDNIRKYIEIFINKSSGYLNTLLEILKKIKKSEFYKIVVFVMEKLNEKGKEYIYSNSKFCKYHSLMYFEQSKSYYDQYLSEVNEAQFNARLLQSLNKEKNICIEYLEDIKSGVVVLLEAAFSGGKLYNENYQSQGRGITNDLKKYSLKNIQNNIEFCKRVLLNYERALSSIQAIKKVTLNEDMNSRNKKEAICIANIIKINEILGNINSKFKTLLVLAERCQFLIDHLSRDKKEEGHLDENEEWYKEFIKIYKVLKDKETTKNEDYNELLSKVKKVHGEEVFNEIENNFKENKGTIEFIDFILENHPYTNYNKSDTDFKTYSTDLLLFLIEKYNPDNYSYSTPEEELTYCIVHEISKKLSNLYQAFRH